MLLFFFVCFYAPISPLVVPVALLGTIFHFWVDKYLLLRRYKVPETMGHDMALFFSNSIPWGMALYATSVIIFNGSLSENIIPGIVCMIVAGTYIILPIRITIIRYIMKRQNYTGENVKTYE